ncbi:hypothetical protein AOR13_1636 [Alteromonas stellipolaris LMG 21856]|nr:hypothetical protein AOR13_1636 [Alteromonas stellipolaris LMG 21856]
MYSGLDIKPSRAFSYSGKAQIDITKILSKNIIGVLKLIPDTTSP